MEWRFQLFVVIFTSLEGVHWRSLECFPVCWCCTKRTTVYYFLCGRENGENACFVVRDPAVVVQNRLIVREEFLVS